MRRKLCASVILLSLLIPAGATTAAQTPLEPPKAMRETAVGQPLTLAECVRIALERNPRERAARLGITAAEEAVGTARAPYYPEVSAVAGYSRFDRHIFLPSGVSQLASSSTLGGRDDWHGSLQADYLLYDSGRRRANLEAALANRAASEENAAMIRQELILNVHQSFFDILAWLREEEARQESLARRREHLDLVTIRFEAGDVAEADVIRSRVEVADAELDLVQAASQIRTARAGLNAAMGLPVLLAVEVAPSEPPLLFPGEIDLDQAMAAALAQRPEIRKAHEQVAINRYRVEAVRGEYGPKLAAEAGYGRRDDEFAPEDEEWAAGINLEVPLFTGFARRHETGRARAELARAEAEAEDLGLAVQEEVAVAFSRLLEAYQSVQATEALLKDARESLRLTHRRYEVGAATINDLLDVEASLTEAESEHIKAVYGHHLGTSRFRRAIGVLGPETGGGLSERAED